MSDPESPDTGEVLRTWLASVAAVTAITSTRIGLSVTGTQAAIRYSLLGGGDFGGGAVWARYQVECWGPGNGAPDDGTADSLARKILAAAPTFCGRIGAVDVSGATAAFPYAMDDGETGRARRIVEVSFTARP